MLPIIRNILFAAGLGNETSYVLRFALSLAQKYDARIYIIHSHEVLNITDQSMAGIYMLQEGMEDVFEKALLDSESRVTAYLEEICQKELENISADPELIAGIRISRHAPKSAILAAAEDFEADLIVMGSHRHAMLTDALLGSTTMKILHSAEVPVLVVRIPKDPSAE